MRTSGPQPEVHECRVLESVCSRSFTASWVPSPIHGSPHALVLAVNQHILPNLYGFFAFGGLAIHTSP